MIFLQPYPVSTSVQKSVITALAVGLFVFLFLYVFQPFSLLFWQHPSKTLLIGGYGGVTFFFVAVFSVAAPRLLPSVFHEAKWKVWKEITWIMFLIFIIAIGNMLYSYAIGVSALSFRTFLFFAPVTLAVGIFPCSMVIMINYLILNGRNVHKARQINQVIAADTLPGEPIVPRLPEEEETAPPPQETLLILTAENGKDQLSIPPDALLFLSSADNYVEVVYIRSGAVVSELFRNTLKSLAGQLTAYADIYRCHRSFMVNLQKVTRVSGNSQGYKLHFAETETTVPVSRNLGAGTAERIRKIHGKA